MNITAQIAWRNIWRNKRRSWLNIGGIGFSTFLFVLVMPIQFGAYDVIIDASLRVYTGYAQIQKQGYQDRPEIYNAIPHAEDIANTIRDSDEFEAVAVRASGFALLSSRQRSYGGQILGVQHQYEPKVSTIPASINAGRNLSSDDAEEMLIGSSLARDLKVQVGDEVTILGTGKDGSIAATILPVVGIFTTNTADIDRHVVEIPLNTFQRLFTMGDSAHNITVIGKSVADLDNIAARLDKFIKDRDGLVVLDWTQLIPGVKQATELDKASGFLFMIVLVIVVVFSILNTFLMLVLERTREFGLMLALGDKPLNISKLVILESMIMTLLGLAIGMLLAVSINLYLAVEGLRLPGMQEMMEAYKLPIDVLYPKFDSFTLLFGPAVVFISTNIAAWIPLARIHRLKPVEAMRMV